MSLNKFFTINLPYGIARNENGEWMAFNREYLPLGFNTRRARRYPVESWPDLPIYTRYKGLSEKLLIELAHDDKAIERDDNGKINKIWFYDDSSNPSNHARWDNFSSKTYFYKLEKLSKLKVVSER